jgi:uncharacterized membrane-anchored protein
VAEKLDVGYAISIALFGGVIALIAFAHYVLELNPILSFWLAYVMTRPLGASIGDEMSQSSHVTKRDQAPPSLVAAEA